MRIRSRSRPGGATRRVAWVAWWSVVAASIGAPAAMIAAADFPPLPEPRDPRVSQTTRIFDREGRLLAVLHGEENRYVIARARMPAHLRQAVIAAEDKNFYRHAGVSLPAVLRASLANLSNKRVVQGGSTITQQYVRNAYAEVGRERTVRRKLREAVLAYRLEEELTKDEILDKYINTVYFGRGAYGVEAAAKTYFRKSADKLRLHEAAFLAGIIRAPETYAANLDSARKRRNDVLREMSALGSISRRRASAAIKRRLDLRLGAAEKVRAAYFVEYVRRLLRTPKGQGGFGLTDQDVFTGGLRVYTTLDQGLQRSAERAVASVLDREDDPEVGMVAMTTSGEIRAMVGGRDFTSLERAHGFNFAVQRGRGGGRQSGSAFKPFTLGAFLRGGYTIREYFRAPSRISVVCKDTGVRWSPANYGNFGYGYINVRTATERSVNTVYAQMIARVGPSEVIDFARDAGIVSPLARVCPLTLGVSGVTPLEMARAYATFATGGRRPAITAVTRIVGPDGGIVASRKPRLRRTVASCVANTINDALQGVMTDGTGMPAAIDFLTAGKTGTTDERKDVWFVGYTAHPGLSTAIWVGYPPKNGRIRLLSNFHGEPATGGRVPGGIWKAFMSEAVETLEEAEFIPPSPEPTPSGGPSPSRTPTPTRTPTARASATDPEATPSPTPTVEEGGCYPPPTPIKRFRPKPVPAPEPTPTPTPTKKKKPKPKPTPPPPTTPEPPSPTPTTTESP